MIETIVSPGVLAIENDQSFITEQPIRAGAAIVGPTVKGRVGIPTLCTTYSDYLNKFGSTFVSGGQVVSYFTSISAYNYFNNGGGALLVTRVASGSFTPATSSFIPSLLDEPYVVNGYVVDGYILPGDNVFELETLSEGTMLNSNGPTGSNGTIVNGTSDNYRWQIVSPNTSSGTFTLLIRQGNDSSLSPSILETWTNLSLDPLSPRYIERIIGNQTSAVIQDGGDYYVQDSGLYPNNSRYVRVKQVNNPTPNYFDNNGIAKSEYTSSIPVASEGVFGGAIGDNVPTTYSNNYYQNITNINTQGINAGDYYITLQLLANKEAYKFNYLTLPGLIYSSNYPAHTSTLTSVISNIQNRGDTFLILDITGYGNNTIDALSSVSGLDTSYAAAYYPWLLTVDPNSGLQVWVPPSTLIAGAYSFSDNISAPWIAPAGLTRGVLSTAIRAERFLSQAVRDTLYESNVNPIATFQNSGVTIFGQKTLQKKRSSLDPN